MSPLSFGFNPHRSDWPLKTLFFEQWGIRCQPQEALRQSVWTHSYDFPLYLPKASSACDGVTGDSVINLSGSFGHTSQEGVKPIVAPAKDNGSVCRTMTRTICRRACVEDDTTTGFVRRRQATHRLSRLLTSPDVGSILCGHQTAVSDMCGIFHQCDYMRCLH